MICAAAAIRRRTHGIGGRFSMSTVSAAAAAASGVGRKVDRRGLAVGTDVAAGRSASRPGA